MIRSHRVLITVTTVAASLLLPLVPTAAHAAAKSDEVRVKFESTKPGSTIKHVDNSGSAATTVTVRRRNGGKIVARHSRATKSRTADFPAYVAGPGAPRAVVGVVNKGKERLSPGGRAFTIGIDFRVDAAAIAATDDGNNLLQRGNFGSPSQYKLQVDDGRVGCRIKGAKGDTLLVAPTVLTPDRWYRSQCSLKKKRGSLPKVVLRVGRLDKHARFHLVERATISQKFGSLTFPKKRPLTIGGKLKDSLKIPGRVEQFNGQLDNAYFRIN